MTALAGLFALHLLGAVLRAVTSREPVSDTLRSPASLFLALGLLYATALGLAGLVLGASLLLCVRLAPRPPSMRSSGLPLLLLAVGAVVVLVRPWMPVYWDEFVWLGKARFESIGFGVGVSMALDPTQHLIPPGYPPLWPLAVGWTAMGRDEVGAHVAASGLLTVATFATALEAWWPKLEAFGRRGHFAALLLGAPFVWVHARAAYVDLPVGLLGVAVLGFLVTERLPLACALAVVTAGLKDEGLAHVLAATVGALVIHRGRRPLLQWTTPALLATIAVVTWSVLLRAHHVQVVDHALNPPALGWLPTLARLLALHASDVPTWGLTWAVALGVAAAPPPSRDAAGVRWALAANFAFLSAALLLGPERVRVFAENGTLLNRLLVQLFPTAALMTWFALAVSPHHREASPAA